MNRFIRRNSAINSSPHVNHEILKKLIQSRLPLGEHGRGHFHSPEILRRTPPRALMSQNNAHESLQRRMEFLRPYLGTGNIPPEASSQLRQLIQSKLRSGELKPMSSLPFNLGPRFTDMAKAKMLEKIAGGMPMKGGGNVFKKVKKAVKKAFHQPLGKRDGGVRKTLRKTEKVFRKEVLPIIAPIAGAMLGGPIGATAAGALAGGLRSSHNIGKNMIKGGMKGLAIGGGMELAKGLGGKLGQTLGMGSKGAEIAGKGADSAGFFEKFLGMGGDSASKGSEGFFDGLLGGAGDMIGSVGKGIGGALGGIGGALDGLGLSPVDALLMGGSIAGSLGGKTKVDPEEQAAYENLKHPKHQLDALPDPKFSAYLQQTNPEYGRNVNFDNPDFSQDPMLNNQLPTARYAQGGYVHGGYIHGESGGQDDDYDAYIPKGSYVMDATTVSSLGDGNSSNGERKLRMLRDRFLDSGITSFDSWNKVTHHPIKVKLSRGEAIIEPEVVRGIGKGDFNKGAKKLDIMRKKLRKEKGMKKFLPPKSKPIGSYLR